MQIQLHKSWHASCYLCLLSICRRRLRISRKSSLFHLAFGDSSQSASLRLARWKTFPLLLLLLVVLEGISLEKFDFLSSYGNDAGKVFSSSSPRFISLICLNSCNIVLC